jgi:hypothetical protein
VNIEESEESVVKRALSVNGAGLSIGQRREHACPAMGRVGGFGSCALVQGARGTLGAPLGEDA